MSRRFAHAWAGLYCGALATALGSCAPTLTLDGEDTTGADGNGPVDDPAPVDGGDSTAAGTDLGTVGDAGTAVETATDPTPREPNALVGGPQLRHTRIDAATDLVETVVDAQQQAEWVFLRMGDGAQVAPKDPDDSTGWDIGFQRFKIRSNGGINGRGPVRVARLEKTAIAALTTAPGTGWLVDTATPPDPEAPAAYTFDSVFNSGGSGVQWFEYNGTDHTLRPRDVTYAIDTGHGYYALRILSYYDSVGSPAVLTFQWRPLAAPTP